MKVERLAAVLEDSRSGFWGTDAGLGDIDVRVVRNGDIQKDGIRWMTLPLRGVTDSEAARAAIRRDDILITTSGDCGFVAHVVEEPTEPTIASNFVRILRFDTSRVAPRYMFHYMHTAPFRARLKPYIRGTTLKNLSLAAAVKHVDVPMPDKATQLRIAEILDEADALRAKRGTAVAQLDALTRSVFLDIFGDPLINPKTFPIRRLAEFYVNQAEGTKCGPFGSALKKSELVSGGIAVWNMDNIDPSGRMTMPFRMWIPESKYRKLEAYAVADGDVIVSRAGTVGKMCVVSTGGARSIISTNLIRLRFGADLLPLYFVSLMTHCRGRVGRLKTGADGAFTHMNTGILDTLKFPYPPLGLQRQFAAIVEVIEACKLRQATQLAELDSLFTTLQRLAFRGELQA
jgi:type I restriction enzyme S subunit